MKYPKEYLDEIKSRLKVSSIVSKYITIKKRGKEFVGLSPFKNEKTPSFTVNDEKGFYHCFSTGEHGNIFDFLMKTQNLKFGEAVRNLANLAGLQPYRFSKDDEIREKEMNDYISVHKLYIEKKKYDLTKLINSQNEISNYLKKRKLNIDIINEFNIGYSSLNSNVYDEFANKFDEKVLQETGLFLFDERKKIFVERFRGRLLFPINSLTAKPLGIGGRKIDDNNNFAKYINSPETKFFKKGNNLYNLDKARKESNKIDQVYLVEGYMDVITLFNHDVKNCVANLGTALTSKQIMILSQFFKETIICFDSDDSGFKAAIRAAENALKYLKPENQISFLFLPKGEDPDSFVKKNKKSIFLDYSKNKKIQIHKFIFENYLSESTKSPSSLAMVEKKLKFITNSIQDETVRKYVLAFFMEEMSRYSHYNNKYNFINYKSDKIKYKSLESTQKIFQETKQFSAIDIKEFSILYIVLNNLNFFYNRIDLIDGIEFVSKENKIIFESICVSLKNGNFDQLNLDNKILSEIEKYATIKHIIKKNDKDEFKLIEIFDDIKKDLKTYGLEQRIKELESKFAKDFSQNTFDEIKKLKKEQNIN